MGGHQSSTSAASNAALAVQKYSAEYKFCDKLLEILSNYFFDYQSEYRKRFARSPDGKIDWDFWTGRSSYESAYEKTLLEIDSLSIDVASELHHLAVQVVSHRKSELNRSTGASYRTHVHVHKNWQTIEEKLRQKLQNHQHHQRQSQQQEEEGISSGTGVLLGAGAVAVGVGLLAWLGAEARRERR